MKESSTYQLILDEGRAEGEAKGELKGERRMLLRLGLGRLGEPDALIQRELEKIVDAQRLEELALRLPEVESWQELLQL